MTVKLNLTIDEAIVAKSKRYAAKQKTTVSKMVQNLLKKELTAAEAIVTKRDFVKRTAGIIKLKDGAIVNSRDAYLKKKYGL